MTADYLVAYRSLIEVLSDDYADKYRHNKSKIVTRNKGAEKHCFGVHQVIQQISHIEQLKNHLVNNRIGDSKQACKNTSDNIKITHGGILLS